MDSDGLPIIGRNVDLNKVPAIPQKRTVAFINHYLSRSAQILNEVSAAAERQLEKALVQLQQLEAGVCILEGKLDSIPGLTDGITLESELETEMAMCQKVVTAQPSSYIQSEDPIKMGKSPTEDPGLSQKPPPVAFEESMVDNGTTISHHP
ncbi:WASH complex subunit CCDC53-like [Tropilaelaps mercedesae]|uniref:WASH complex subunit CCDC53-like n=1 Tax=Tropilaelaps mercedesae TaxID=418985 RepID=A0A1V9XUU9_9ACAR|nr:WASH complex subunit CCDC53-like [Tropilaelaps mercedesae]